MKRRILTVRRSFRMTPDGSAALDHLADTVNRTATELVREAVTQYVAFHREKISKNRRQYPFG